MTYTVKNGTWCKDNQGEYLSTTLTGLKAMRKAGQVPEGTRVVVHEPRQPAATLIQSLNPNPPEGFFVPDGSAFDTEVYTDLAAIFPDGKLPDLREYVLVMAGQNSANIRHDVFAAGEAKQDQAQLVEHTHDVTDPGHTHDITDPGHDHGRGTQNITGKVAGVGDSTPTGAFEFEEDIRNFDGNGGYPKQTYYSFDASRSWTGRSEIVETGITVSTAETGITVNAKGDNNVTRTKQFGVYYYIAF